MVYHIPLYVVSNNFNGNKPDYPFNRIKHNKRNYTFKGYKVYTSTDYININLVEIRLFYQTLIVFLLYYHIEFYIVFLLY